VDSLRVRVAFHQQPSEPAQSPDEATGSWNRERQHGEHFEKSQEPRVLLTYLYTRGTAAITVTETKLATPVRRER